MTTELETRANCQSCVYANLDLWCPQYKRWAHVRRIIQVDPNDHKADDCLEHKDAIVFQFRLSELKSWKDHYN